MCSCLYQTSVAETLITLIILNKIKRIEKLSEGTTLCTVDIIVLYPNIPHGQGHACLCKFSETRDNKQSLSDTLAELVEVDLNLRKICLLNIQILISF